MSRWPSRRLQIGVMIVLALGAAFTVFMPPMTRHSKAKRLYLDGWFESSVPKLEKSLELYPGNSMYEQALVWQYPKDKLPDLLKERHLGLDAQRLAAGLIYQSQFERTQDPVRQLELADTLIKADPTNALPHYRKAFILNDMGRLDDAIAEVRQGNALDKMRFYVPSVSHPILESSKSPDTYFSGDFKSRRLARAIVDHAYAHLREGKLEEAAGMMEDCLRMGVAQSSAEPPTIMGVLGSLVVQRIASNGLEPIYKDFGMDDRLPRLKRLALVYDRASKAARGEIRMISFEKATVLEMIPWAIIWIAGSATVLIILAFLSWILPAIRRRGQPSVRLLSWSEGWIARVSSTNMLFVAAAMFFGMRALDMYMPSNDMGAYVLLVALGQIVIMALGLRVLHHRCDQDTGERTGIFRFALRSPAAVKAWIRKSLMVMFAGQIAFAACLALLAIILYKPFYGGHPWQIGRFELLTISHEEATMRRVGDDLRKAYLGR